MRFVDCVAAPSKKGVIEEHTGVELFQIISEHARQAERCGEEPGRLRHQLKACRICSANDQGEAVERFGLQSELFDHGIKGAAITPMAPEHIVDVEWNSFKAISHVHHFGRLDEEKYRRSVDETADQPRAGDPINLWTRACHPDCVTSIIAAGHLVVIYEKPFGFTPRLKSAIEVFGCNAFVPQPCSDALRELLSPLANDNYLLVGEFIGPV
jgi:hypothetical protein